MAFLRKMTLRGVGKRPMTLREVYDALESLRMQGVDLARASYTVRTAGMMNPVIKEIELEFSDGPGQEVRDG